MATDLEFQLTVRAFVLALNQLVKLLSEGSPTLTMSDTIEVGNLIGGKVDIPVISSAKAQSDLVTGLVGSSTVGLPCMSSKPSPSPQMTSVWDGSN